MTHSLYTPFVIPLVISAVFCVVMLLVAWRNRAEPVAPWFAGTVIALLVWTVGYVFELTAVGLHAKLAWADVEYAATIALPVLWLQVVLIYTRRAGLSRTLWAVVSVLGCALFVSIVVNPRRLFRGAPSVVTHGSLHALHPDYGPLWIYGWAPFEYGLVLVAVLLLVRTMLHARSIHVRQSLALLLASLLPLAGGTVYALGLSPWPDYNPAMAVVSLSGLLMAYALFSCRLFDLAPLARDAVIEHLADGVMVFDVKGRLRDYNSAAAHAFPELESDSIGKLIAELFAARPHVGAVLEQATGELREQGHANSLAGRSCDVQSTSTADGAESPLGAPHVLNLRVTSVSSGADTALGLAVVVCDVTERVALLDEALRLATVDGLTGTLTRRRFTELAEIEVARAARRGTPLTLLLLDIDRLKVVNDTHGHVAGDLLLSAVAAGWQNVLRTGDLLGRLGGDEFCVLLPSTAGDEARRIAERLRGSTPLCSPWDGGAPWRSTVSIGMATVQCRANDRFGELLDAADKALYLAKDGGRDRVVVARPAQHQTLEVEDQAAPAPDQGLPDASPSAANVASGPPSD
jgi:diguanylate cyclase (GGDEF)-like protein